MIRLVTIEDAPKLLKIYNYYVLNTNVTFDIDPLSLPVFENKMTSVINQYPFIVFEEENNILGYAYGSKWRPKPAYNQTVETTVYVKHGLHGKQIGTQLYAKLLLLLKDGQYHSALGALTLPNDASVRLHEKFGFKKVAHFKEVGYKFDSWLDVGFWQLHF